MTDFLPTSSVQIVSKNQLKALFSQKFDLNLQKDLLTQENLNVVKTDKWNLMNKKYRLNNWRQFFYFLKQATPSQLYLSYNAVPEILLQVSSTKFLDLKILHLLGNFINNIESLAFLDMQHLQQIDIGFNKITSIKAIHKTRWSYLKKFELRQNKIRESSEFKRMKTSENCEIGQIMFMSGKRLIEDISFYVKFEARFCGTLTSFVSEIIHQDNLLQCLERKDSSFCKI